MIRWFRSQEQLTRQLQIALAASADEHQKLRESSQQIVFSINRLNHSIDVVDSLVRRLTLDLAMRGMRIMATLQDLQAAVTAQETVQASVVTLLQKLSAELQIANDSGDSVAIQAIIDKINNDTMSLAAAVESTPDNTNPTPDPTSTPEPAPGS